MVDNKSAQLNAVFHALADPTRRAMLDSLKLQDRNISELSAPFAMSLEAASKHVKVLERAGLVRRTVRGRTHICQLHAQPMYGGLEWIRHYKQFWNERLDKLEELLHAENRESRKSSKSKRSRRKQ
ncbi:MAG TPA: metalloregulator ArsR/SmtB family transcription factor [Woeseiaceae bacterium]